MAEDQAQPAAPPPPAQREERAIPEIVQQGAQVIGHLGEGAGGAAALALAVAKLKGGGGASQPAVASSTTYE
jgi:hypothetical protein